MAQLRRVFGFLVLIGSTSVFAQSRFQIEEATIDDIHDAIQRGETTCAQVVQAYVDRARAYNGICTQLVVLAPFAVDRSRSST